MLFRVFLLYFTVAVLTAADGPRGIPGHSGMEEFLVQTWNSRYPVPFGKIVKKDLEGKGVLVYRGEKGKLYIYSYIVYVPYLILEKGELKETGSGREIPLRLFYQPGANPELTVQIGIFVEKSDKNRIIGWVKGQ